MSLFTGLDQLAKPWTRLNVPAQHERGPRLVEQTLGHEESLRDGLASSATPAREPGRHLLLGQRVVHPAAVAQRPPNEAVCEARARLVAVEAHGGQNANELYLVRGVM
ncbi:hypothetical protein L916_02586 [Phytophthora nicotianae]|nr:hypothetical protein L916_02586 [Phytophthora nicotianae]